MAELIREKALHCLNEEIHHGIAVAIDRMKAERRVMHIDATIICERDSHKGIIIGKQGSMLKKIGSTARYEIERLLGCKVNLKLWVKCTEKLARQRLSYEKFRIQRGRVISTQR